MDGLKYTIGEGYHHGTRLGYAILNLLFHAFGYAFINISYRQVVNMIGVHNDQLYFTGLIGLNTLTSGP